ncbi:MAG TPA: AgmX/PglI C-terminal domain-containing protein [Polyangia bacterium]|jgi:hypothetical protein
MTARRALVIVGLALAAAVVFYLLRSRPTDAPPVTVVPAGAPANGAAAPAAGRPAAPAARLTPEARARLVGLLERARQQRAGAAPTAAAAGGAGAAAAPASQPGSLDKDYIRAAMGAIKPLLRECYDQARRDRADLAGRLVLQFEIAGEPGIGGVVISSQIGASSTVHHAGLEECVRETVYTLELPAPRNGGIVKVGYPLKFEPSRADGG